jgi:hypothetical protein
MTDALEEAAVSGKLFQPAERSRTPTHSDDVGDLSGSESDSEDDQHGQGPSESSSALIPESDEIHQKGAQTGIKGVLNDKKAHTRQNDQRRKEGEKELRKGMERVAIVGNTWKEEEELRSKEGGGEVEEWRRKRLAEMKGGGGRGLREVGREGFVGAVEKEGWVVVLIYEPVSEDSHYVYIWYNLDGTGRRAVKVHVQIHHDCLTVRAQSSAPMLLYDIRLTMADCSGDRPLSNPP